MTGDELRAWMADRYTVRGLALACGVSRSTIQRWQAGGVSRLGEGLIALLTE